MRSRCLCVTLRANLSKLVICLHIFNCASAIFGLGSFLSKEPEGHVLHARKVRFPASCRAEMLSIYSGFAIEARARSYFFHYAEAKHRFVHHQGCGRDFYLYNITDWSVSSCSPTSKLTGVFARKPIQYTKTSTFPLSGLFPHYARWNAVDLTAPCLCVMANSTVSARWYRS